MISLQPKLINSQEKDTGLLFSDSYFSTNTIPPL